MRPVVAFHGVSRTYAGPPPVHALLPCDLTIEQGEYVTVVGPSGSGKSTFMNLLGLLDRPSTGRYEFDGIDVASIDDGQRTALRGRRIGFVFQAFHLLPHRTAVENVALAQLYTGRRRRDRRTAAADALDLVGLSHRRDAMPTTLSGGERQRVAIARALVNTPRLLLCDEPTGNLDSGTAAIVLNLLDELHRSGLTIVVITHDMKVAARGERTIRIADGTVVAEAGNRTAGYADATEPAHA